MILFQFCFLFLISYCLYVFPIQMGLKWGIGMSLSFFVLSMMVVVVAALLFYYFKTKTKLFILKFFASIGLGVCFFASLITFMIFLLTTYIDVDDFNKFISMILLTSICAIYARYQGSIIRLKTITIDSSKLTESKKIVFISDVHIGTRSSDYLELLVKQIQSLNPDYVLIGGDLIDSSATTIEDLSVLTELSMPIYFVTGNHEYYLECSDVILSQLKDVSIHWLDDKEIHLSGFQLIGVNDNQSTESQCRVISRCLDLEQFSIAMVHKPSCFDELDQKPDLMLSGHTHNGQIFPFGLFVRLRFPKIYGLYEDNCSKLYVSSGVGTWGNSMRLGSVNEIVCFQLNSS
ncbi:metallophosphoesterase [bacterium]|nr:metallophosphoesterase [Actinomycetota bacterium]MBE33251.1 metallophosphoesterase [bacterium]